jgi:hypothetical protein
MSSMMGMNPNQEDLFGKLDSMREVITEVNTQFKDPVSFRRAPMGKKKTWVLKKVLFPDERRTRRRLSASAFPSSYHSTRPSGSFRNSRATRSTRTTLSSTSSCFRKRVRTPFFLLCLTPL